MVYTFLFCGQKENKKLNKLLTIKNLFFAM